MLQGMVERARCLRSGQTVADLSASDRIPKTRHDFERLTATSWRLTMSRTQSRYGTKSYRRILIRKDESRHHRKPRSLGGSDEPANISVVTQKHHNAWHTLFSNYSPETIASIITEKWIPKGYRFICVRNG